MLRSCSSLWRNPQLSGNRIALGTFADRSPAMASVTLNHSDTLVLFTDGVTEAMSPSQEELGEAAFIETFAGSRDRPVAEIVSRIFATVDFLTRRRADR